MTTSISRVTILLAITGLFVTQQVGNARQALSPSTTGRQTPSVDDPVAKELADAESATPVEPAQALLDAMNTTIAFDVIGSDVEQPLLEVAKSFLAGNQDDVLSQLEAIKANASLPPAPLLIAGMLFAAGNPQQGRLWLERTAAENPGYPATYAGFARIAITEQRVTDAEALLEKTKRAMDAGTWTDDEVKLFQTEYLDGLTDVAIRRQKLDEAKVYLEQLRQILPENAKIPLRMAQIEFDLENIEASLAQLTLAKELAANLRVPEVIIADWFYRKRKVEESEKWVSDAATKYPTHPGVQLDYAKWLVRNERIREALDVINKAESLGANKYVATFLKGQVAFARRSYDLAEMHFQNLNQLRPGDADATNMLALSLIEGADAEKKSKALQLAEMNQKLYQQSPTTMATLGWVYYKLGRIAEANNAFRQIAATKNLEPASAFFLATFLNGLEDPQPENLKTAAGLLKAALENKAYFMYRAAAEELLAVVEERLPPEEATSDNKATDDKAGTDGKGGR